MDATRARRLRDGCRQRWYALCRTRRFARLLQFPAETNRTGSRRTHPKRGQ
jgi:hypothetical protein